MKIADLAKQLNITPQELRQKITQSDFKIAKKTRTIRDDLAQKLIEKFQKDASKTPQLISEKQPKIETSKIEDQKKVELPPILTVKDFAGLLKLPVTDVIRELMKNKIIATINENIDFETAAIIAEDLGFKPIKIIAPQDQDLEEEQNVKPKPPVVVIIGHVDHGKTKLLDTIRKTNVIATESGGITQHIGAYQIILPLKDQKRKITFLDTPGHESFVIMREHGTKIADLAILVVAADEGVKPQTKEAIDHAKSAGVPIIVALNKIDKPGADLEKTKKQLSELGLIPEEWGGTTLMVPISAKMGKGIKELLEMVILLADVEKLQASFSGRALGVVIESHLDPQKGPVATILVQRGILKLKDFVVIGNISGKIRIMENFSGAKIKKVFPSDPARIYGISKMADFGEKFLSFETEKEAKDFLEKFIKEERLKTLFVRKTAQKTSQEEIRNLKIVLKADVSGSLTAVEDSLKKISTPKTKVVIVSSGIGNISESDINDASASGAKIVGFKVKVANEIQKLAFENQIPIEIYEIIYELIEKTKKDLIDIAAPEIQITEIGKGKVIKIFRQSRRFRLIGVKITKGEFRQDAKIKFFRDNQEIGEGRIETLQVEKKDRLTAYEGEDCGINCAGSCKTKINDLVKVFEIKEIKPEI